MHGSDMPTRIRHASRVIVLDPQDRVLVFRISPDFVEHSELWIPPGGGIERGETPVQAAERELREETGLSMLEPIRGIWTRRHIATWNNTRYDTRESYFFGRVRGKTPRPDISDLVERRAIVNYRWWSAEEILGSAAAFAPRRLGAFLPYLAAGHFDSCPAHLED